MKLRSHKTARRGDKITHSAVWVDKMKRPAAVRLVLEKGNDVDSDQPLVEGDITDVNGVLYGLADIAWSNGWRPRGLIGKLATEIEKYIIPKEGGR